ncbi:MAG: hypothetical protein ACRD8W_27555 [Nitrososphaeraceae archaeon]
MTTVDLTTDSSQLETSFAIFVTVMIIIIVTCMGIPLISVLKHYLSDMKRKTKSNDDKLYRKKA